ncbi:MAG: RNA polymerase sigma factor [Myxococcales bacterium]
MSPSRSHDVQDTRSDSDALMRVATGDVAAIATLYDRHAAALLQFASRLAGRGDAEDLVHTVFMRVARRAATYDGRAASARAWLFGIAMRVIQERRRSLARSFRAMSRFSSGEVPGHASALGERWDIERALGALSEVQRTVLLLSDVEGFGGEEIAGMLEIPVGTVWTRLHHARRKLRTLLREGT